METKPWFASKTLWVNALAMIAAVTGAMGMDIGLDPEAQASIIGGIMAVVNIALRLTTNKGVSSN